MAIDASIPLKVATPNFANSISDMLDLGAKSLALKKAKETYDSDVERIKAESREAQTKADVAQQTAPAVIQEMQQNAQKSLLGLNDAQRTSAGRFVSSLAGQPPEVVKEQLDGLAELQPQLKPAVDWMWHNLEKSAQDPKAFAGAIQRIGRATMTVPEQLATRTPGGPMISNNQQAAMINTNPGADQPMGSVVPGTAVQMQIGPEAQTFNPQTNAPEYFGAGGRGGPQTAPSLGVPEQIAQNQQDIKAVRDAADQVPVQRNINQAIMKLSRNTTTGPGSPVWHSALSALSLGNFGDNYQELGKYLERNALQAMAAMGGSPSDARLSAAAAANGSTSYNPGALQEITRFNDAASTALEKYRQGMDKAVGFRNQDPNALPEFKSAWAKNLDPNVFRVENAIRDGDTMELTKLKKELGEEGLKRLAEKRKNLESLSSTGRLP